MEGSKQWSHWSGVSQSCFLEVLWVWIALDVDRESAKMVILQADV